MKPRFPPVCMALVLGLMPFAPALAAEYTAIDRAASRVDFTYTQMGVGMDGSFGQFDARIRFDPARPDTASATLEIQLASIDTGSTEANEDVKGKVWFDTARHPVARFEAGQFRALGGQRYEATGQLTIKGRTKAVTAPFTLTPQDKSAAVEGAFTIKRSDFAIGEGEWADYAIVADEIRVSFRLRALQGAE